MSTNRTVIPLCRSTYLQDITIALGRRSLKSLRQAHPTLTFDVKQDEASGTVCERFDIEARTRLGGLTKITIWEDSTSWVYFAERRDKASRTRAFETHANLVGMNIEDAAKLIRATLRDFESVQHVWQGIAVSI
jgi:hypothetical protein